MNQPIWMVRPPARLLLASDLSARCDRALDRAAQLAGQWKAELVVLNVADAPQAPDLALAWAADHDDSLGLRYALQQLQADVEGLVLKAELRVVRGDAAERIREEANSSGSGLVISGMACDEPFGRYLVGSTVQRLTRTLAQPLLVVRGRVRGPYRRMVVATDFSESSRHALHAAVRYFPAADLTLYHARPSHGIEAESAETADRLNTAIRQGECAEFLAASQLPAETGNRLQVLIERGPLALSLTRYVREHGVDLVVMGTHGRTGLLNVLIGSSAARLLDWLPCDTMIVRDPLAAA